MVQYTTQEGLRRTLDEGSTWLWSRSRETFWKAGRDGGGYPVQAIAANCMGDSIVRISASFTGGVVGDQRPSGDRRNDTCRR